MSARFSKDGKYFAQLSSDGKLKLWNTASSTLEQEFTPNFHLAAPCTCLDFVQPFSKADTPRKKRRRGSHGDDASAGTPSPLVVLGTTSGLLLVYSVAKGDLVCTINSETSLSVNCLSTYDGNVVYSGAEQNILVWNLQRKQFFGKWVGGNDRITSILITHQNQLLTASKIIKLWDIQTREVVRTFTGHSTDICFLQYVTPKGKDSSDTYLISGSKGDRLLACWNLGEKLQEKNAIANFLMEDIVYNVTVNVSAEGATNMAATVRSGVVHVFQHTLNGKCSKPIKPRTTIQVVTDSSSDSLVSPIHIIGAVYRDDATLCIGYGSDVVKTFENITISSYQKVQCLVRQNPSLLTTSSKKSKDKSTKVVQPKVGNDVHYLTQQNVGTTAIKKTQRLQADGQLEVPMEKRLENLTLNKVDESKVPRADNVAQLLVQGLHSQDQNILRMVLSRKDETVIRNTLKRLPMTVIVALIKELTSLIAGKTMLSNYGCLWLRNLILIHASVLLSNPDLSVLLGPIVGSVENRLALQVPLCKLRGRMDLLVSQGSLIASAESEANNEALLVHNDKDSSDSEDDVINIDASSDSDNNEWMEESSGAEENGVEVENNQDDGSDDDSSGS